jgi:NADH:ubiquinone oxidoreductase subunit E
MWKENGFALRVCRGTDCNLLSDPLLAAAKKTIADGGLEKTVGVEESGCLSRCGMGPNILVERWRDGQRNEEALMMVLADGQKHDDIFVVNQARPDEMAQMINWFLKHWKLQPTE